MATVEFKFEKRPDERTGVVADTVVKYEEGKEPEAWCSVIDLDRLFDTCSKRWAVNGWDLEKLMTAVREASFE